jgi:hypothetical protein
MAQEVKEISAAEDIKQVLSGPRVGGATAPETDEIIAKRIAGDTVCMGSPISVLCGFTQSGLPFGMQITGALGDEGTVLRLARAYEQATEWHKRQPIAEQKA